MGITYRRNGVYYVDLRVQSMLTLYIREAYFNGALDKYTKPGPKKKRGVRV